MQLVILYKLVFFCYEKRSMNSNLNQPIHTVELKNIEDFFLTNLLRVAIFGVILISVSDLVFFNQDQLSIIIDLVIFLACLFSYFIRKKNSNLSVYLVCGITLLAMFYQSLSVPANTNTSFTIILVVAFVFSIMMKKWHLYISIGITLLTVLAIFTMQYLNPALRYAVLNEIITVTITYLILFFILVYATTILKHQYDTIYLKLNEANKTLELRSKDVSIKNDDLMQMHEELNAINQNLEEIVNDRTEKLRIRTQKLIKYGFNNAHHLRGPVARLLGLIYIRKLETEPDNDFFFSHVEEQAQQIDQVVKHINDELGNNDLSEADYLLSEDPKNLPL